MGAELSHLLQEAFLPVLRVLIQENFCYLWEGLKHFVQWLFKKRLVEYLKGFVRWLFMSGKDYLFYKLVKTVESIGEWLGNVHPGLKKPLLLPSPHVPDSSCLPQEKSGDGFCLSMQGCYHLPDVSRSLLFPSQDSAGQAVLGSSPNLLPVPTYPVLSLPVFPQDGTGNVASPAILSAPFVPSSPISTPATQNGISHVVAAAMLQAHGPPSALSLARHRS